MAGEIEIKGPQPPPRSPPGGVVIRKILRVKGRKHAFRGPRRVQMFGPKAPRGHRRILRKEAKHAAKAARLGRISTRQFKAIVGRVQRRVARAASSAARKAARVQARGKGKPRKGKPRRGLRSGRRAGGRGYRRSRGVGWNWFLALAKKVFKTPSRSDGRNHGSKNSGYKGKTGRAGYKPKGRLW